MHRKISLLAGLLIAMLANTGCCRLANRWCNTPQQAPQCCVPAAPACYPAPAPQAYYPAPAPQACYPAPPQGYQRPAMCQ